MTDWTMQRKTAEQIHAGNDLMEPGMPGQTKELVEAVRGGELPVAELDACVRRILQYIVRTPRFNGYKYSDAPDLDAHAKVARASAVEGMVLLENKENTLPMKEVRKVALYGVASYEFIAGGTGSGNVNKPYIRNIADGLLENGYAIDQDLRDWYESYIKYSRIDIKNNPDPNDSGLMLGEKTLSEMAVSRTFMERLEPETDIAVLTISRNAGEGDDRKAVDGDFTLTGKEREMMQTLADIYHSHGKKLVVVLNIGGVIETASWKDIPDAILLAWTPGQEGGGSVADILAGKANPSGKLPMTFPVRYFDIPSSYNFPYNFAQAPVNPYADLAVEFGIVTPKTPNYDYTEYKEGIWVGYRYFSTARKEVSYPFGYGLSYTTFSYANPVVKAGKDGMVTATITVRNTGSTAGKEVVQVYVTAPEAGLVKPVIELKAFGKTRELAPGQSQTLTLTIDPYTLASFNEQTSAWETAAGSYTLYFGASSEDLRAQGTFKLAKPLSWEAHPVCLPAQPVEEIALTR